jgi:hypothetical protein
MSKPSSLAACAGFVLAVLGFAAFAAPPAAAHDIRTGAWRGQVPIVGPAAYGHRDHRSANRLISDVRAGRVACYQRVNYRHRPFYLRRDIRGTRIGAHALRRLLRKGRGAAAIDCYRVY